MKKVIFCLALICGGIGMTQLATPTYAAEMTAASQGTQIRVTGYKSMRGGAGIKTTTTATIEETSDGMKAYIRGEGPYTVRTSDRSEYEYMFRVGEWTYYFNM